MPHDPAKRPEYTPVSRPAPSAPNTDPGFQGTYFLGRYRIVDEIGVGGMASVHLARMDGPGGFQKWVAIKRIHPHLVEDESFVEMFFDEARVAARISHPNVATVFELGKHADTYWIAMEYLHGEPLREVMRRTEEMAQPMPPEIACRVIADAAEGLHSAHELLGKHGEKLELVHRDVTPHNLFVTYDGTTKVVDFGIAKFSSRMASTQAGTLKGKLAYMSPEQAYGEGIDRRTDIFALGVVLWELTTGQRLFRMESDLDTLAKVQECNVAAPSTIIRGYPLDLEKIVLKALAKNKAERFRSAREFSRALQSLLMRRGLFVASDEVANYMRSIFQDRLEKREEHLRWAAEVTQTINVDAMLGPTRFGSEGSSASASSEVVSQSTHGLPPRPAAGIPALASEPPRNRPAAGQPPLEALPSHTMHMQGPHVPTPAMPTAAIPRPARPPQPSLAPQPPRPQSMPPAPSQPPPAPPRHIMEGTPHTATADAPTMASHGSQHPSQHPEGIPSMADEADDNDATLVTVTRIEGLNDTPQPEPIATAPTSRPPPPVQRAPAHPHIPVAPRAPEPLVRTSEASSPMQALSQEQANAHIVNVPAPTYSMPSATANATLPGVSRRDIPTEVRRVRSEPPMWFVAFVAGAVALLLAGIGIALWRATSQGGERPKDLATPSGSTNTSSPVTALTPSIHPLVATRSAFETAIAQVGPAVPDVQPQPEAPRHLDLDQKVEPSPTPSEPGPTKAEPSAPKVETVAPSAAPTPEPSPPPAEKPAESRPSIRTSRRTEPRPQPPPEPKAPAAPTAMGTLRVICSPACDQVTVVDLGLNLGPSPIPGKAIPVGSHRVKLVSSPGGKTVSKVVSVLVTADAPAVVKERFAADE